MASIVEWNDFFPFEVILTHLTQIKKVSKRQINEKHEREAKMQPDRQTEKENEREREKAKD